MAKDSVIAERKALVDQIIENMKNGYVIPKWDWERGSFAPAFNPTTKKQYKASNFLRLYFAQKKFGYTDNRWCTYKQAQEQGWQVKRGSVGVKLEKYIFETVVEELNEQTGQMEKVKKELNRPIVNVFTVFNGEQIEGIPELELPKPLEQDEILDIADRFVKSSECKILHTGDSAYYSPAKDEIHLPDRSLFRDTTSLLKTQLHEMVHSTGHPSRLNRTIQNSFGSPEYAKEELRAELGAFFLESDLGIQLDGEHFNSHTEYLKSWIEALENDPNELYRAISDAQKASDYLEKRYELIQEKDQTEELHSEQAAQLKFYVKESSYDDRNDMEVMSDFEHALEKYMSIRAGGKILGVVINDVTIPLANYSTSDFRNYMFENVDSHLAMIESNGYKEPPVELELLNTYRNELAPIYERMVAELTYDNQFQRMSEVFEQTRYYAFGEMKKKNSPRGYWRCVVAATNHPENYVELGITGYERQKVSVEATIVKDNVIVATYEYDASIQDGEYGDVMHYHPQFEKEIKHAFRTCWNGEELVGYAKFYDTHTLDAHNKALENAGYSLIPKRRYPDSLYKNEAAAIRVAVKRELKSVGKGIEHLENWIAERQNEDVPFPMNAQEAEQLRNVYRLAMTITEEDSIESAMDKLKEQNRLTTNVSKTIMNLYEFQENIGFQYNSDCTEINREAKKEAAMKTVFINPHITIDEDSSGGGNYVISYFRKTVASRKTLNEATELCHEIRSVEENVHKQTEKFLTDRQVKEIAGIHDGNVHYTEEYLSKLNSITDLVQLAEYMGYSTKRVGRNTYNLKEHDSLMIYNRNTYFRHSTNQGGDAIHFLQTMCGLKFQDAVQTLADFNNHYQDKEHGGVHREQSPSASSREDVSLQDEKGELQLPEPCKDSYKRLYAYLMKTRGIPADIVNYCVKNKLLYESDKFHNVVFCSKDKDGVVRHAFRRGTLPLPDGREFKQDVSGSDKRYGFNIPCSSGCCKTVKVYESAIDLLSDMSLSKEDIHRVALGGLADAPLETFLKEHPEIEKIRFGLDRDVPAREAVEKLKMKYTGLGYECSYTPPIFPNGKQGKDFNELLLVRKGMEEKVRSTEFARS